MRPILKALVVLSTLVGFLTLCILSYVYLVYPDTHSQTPSTCLVNVTSVEYERCCSASSCHCVETCDAPLCEDMIRTPSLNKSKCCDKEYCCFFKSPVYCVETSCVGPKCTEEKKECGTRCDFGGDRFLCDGECGSCVNVTYSLSHTSATRKTGVAALVLLERAWKYCDFRDRDCLEQLQHWTRGEEEGGRSAVPADNVTCWISPSQSMSLAPLSPSRDSICMNWFIFVLLLFLLPYALWCAVGIVRWDKPGVLSSDLDRVCYNTFSPEVPAPD